MSKIIVIGTLPISLINFRGALLKELAKEHQVIAMANGFDSNIIQKLNSMGVSYVNYSVCRSGLNPFSDVKTLYQLVRFFKLERPDVILAYTIKPVIWGGIASRLARVKSFYGLVTGLGYAFQPKGFTRMMLTKLICILYKESLKHAQHVIFQNRDNKLEFIKNNIVSAYNCSVVNGSGVDLNYYSQRKVPKKPVFLLIARLLKEKGILEYINAAKLVKSKYPDAEFHLVGPEDPSPDGIDLNLIFLNNERSIIKYHGNASDVRPFIEMCSIYVLPSYHEGIPRTVLEAMAIGRPILTTDVPGCRETVIKGENGWLVERANVEELAERMIWFIENQEQWHVMGKKSRAMANGKFDVHKVNNEILKIMGLSNEKAI